MKNKKTLILVISAVVIMALAGIIYQNNLPKANNPIQAEEKKEEKVPLIDVTFRDLNNNVVHLKDLNDKPILLNFWSTSCPYCLEGLKTYQEYYNKYKDKVNFVMVELLNHKTEDINAIKMFAKENNYTLPIYVDIDGSGGATYNAYALPIMYVIDKDGFVLAKAMGLMNSERLDMALKIIGVLK